MEFKISCTKPKGINCPDIVCLTGQTQIPVICEYLVITKGGEHGDMPASGHPPKA